MPETISLSTLTDAVDRIQAGESTLDVLTDLRDGEQRDVAVLFLDLKGFTAMSEKLDSEMVQLIIDHCFKVFSEDITDNGGMIEKYMGDAIMATFGAHGEADDAAGAHAVRAGILMLERLKFINKKIGDLDLEIGLRIGIEHGPAVTGRIGLQRERDFTLLGDTVTVGLYLEPYAPVNSLMICTTLREKLGGAFEYSDLDPVYMEEIDRTLDVCNVTGIAGEPEPVKPDDWLKPLNRDVDRIARKEGDAADAIMQLRGGERRNVGVMFLVLKGVSLEDDGKIDPLQLQAAFDYCLKIFSPEVTKYGGEVEKYMGDSVLMATFGAHSSFENDAERAVRAAMDTLTHVEGINKELKPLGFKVKVQVGVNHGLVTTGRVGLGRDRDFTVMGDNVNTAQRLEANAPANSLMIQRHLKEQLGDLFTYHDLDPVKVKGKTEPLKVCTVTGVGGQRKERWERDLLTERATFIGRDREITELNAFFDKCSASESPEPIVARLTAVGGIGKSRLIHEFLHHHPAAEELHLHGNTESVIQAPYQLFADLLRRFLNIENKDVATFKSALNKLSGDLEEAAPYLASILGIPLEVERLEAMDPQARLLETQLALAAFINAVEQNISGSAPLLIVLDDLHWIDPSSQKALEFLLNKLSAEQRQFWLLITRPENTLPEKLPREQLSLLVEPLDRDNTIAMIESMLPGIELKDTDWDLLHSKTTGAPFFIEELINTLVKAEVIVDGDEGWVLDQTLDAAKMPDSIGGLVKARIDKLDERGREILSQGSVYGTECETKCLEHINDFLKKPTDDIVENANKIAQSNLVVIPDEERFVFTSQVVQEVAYEGLLIRNRSLLHRLVAEYLEAKGVGKTLNDAPLMFHHYSKTEDYERLFHYLDLAIDLANRNYDLQSALKLATQGVELLNQMEENDANFSRRYDVITRRVQVHNFLGNREEQAEDINWTLEFAKKSGDKEKTSTCLANLAEMHVYTTKYEDALNALAELEPHYDDIPITTRSRYHRYRGIVFSKTGKFEESLESYNQVIELDPEGKDAKSLSGIHLNIGLLYTERSEYDKAQEHFEQALEFNAEANDRRNKGMILNNMGIVRKNNGQYSEALNNYRQVYEIFETIGDKNFMAFSLGNMGITQHLLGQYQEALNSMELASFFFEEVKNPVAVAMSRQILGAILTEIDEFGAAQEHLNAAFETGEQVGFKPLIMDALKFRAQLEERRGDAKESLASADKGIAVALENKDTKRELAFLTAKALATLRLGDLQDARDLATESLTLLAKMPNSEDAERVHYINYLILKQNLDESAHFALSKAREIVDSMAEKLDEEDRARYLAKPLNKSILEAGLAGADA